jgi:hypothetical protein
MEEIPSEALEMVASDAPHFLARVQAAQAIARPGRRPSAVRVTLDEITPDGDVMLVYACVCYSLSQGVPITFVPAKRRKA